MLNETHLQRYADVLLWGLRTARKTPFRKGEAVLLRFGPPALRLVEILHRRLLELGLNPVLRFTLTPAMERDFFGLGHPRQLTYVPPGEAELCRSLGGSMVIYAPESLTHLGDVDPGRIARALVARKPFREILDRRDQQGLFGWTLGLLPTPELARQAGLDLPAYSRQVVRACFLDRADPVAHWRGILQRARKVKRWLDGLAIDHLRVEGTRTDLVVIPGDRRRWLGMSGHNIPSFEIFTSPDWRGTRGVFFADQPSFRSGNRVQGVELEFRRGRVVRAAAAEGEAFLRRQLAMDPGACRLGEFSLTDRRFSRIGRYMANTLFDENYGGRHGNCHVALGSAYSDAFAGDPAELTPPPEAPAGLQRLGPPLGPRKHRGAAGDRRAQGGRQRDDLREGLLSLLRSGRPQWATAVEGRRAKTDSSKRWRRKGLASTRSKPERSRSQGVPETPITGV